MTDQGRRGLGVFIGVWLVVGLLPGVTVGAGSDVFLSAVLAIIVFGILTKIVLIAPTSERPAAPLPVLAGLAIGGFIEDVLIWLLIRQLADQLDAGLRLDGYGTVIAAAAVVRASIWAALFLLPGRKLREPVTD
ncbi:hypothetical protein [Streptomyces sp. NPDC050738]|uniref:hypothetical protein n=1 Tax=Streptomyces sp. NPDC050738 TaxID=3154744 RepID=UPI003429696B